MSDHKVITLTLPVVIPANLIPDGYEAVRVCSEEERAEGEWLIGFNGDVIESRSKPFGPGDLRIVVRKRPTWTPPKGLRPDEYLFKEGELRTGTVLRLNSFHARSVFRDWTDPPRDGIWRVNEDGTATYLRSRPNEIDR